jgi:hypothetical protein
MFVVDHPPAEAKTDSVAQGIGSTVFVAVTENVSANDEQLRATRHRCLDSHKHRRNS